MSPDWGRVADERWIEVLQCGSGQKATVRIPDKSGANPTFLSLFTDRLIAFGAHLQLYLVMIWGYFANRQSLGVTVVEPRRGHLRCGEGRRTLFGGTRNAVDFESMHCRGFHHWR